MPEIEKCDVGFSVPLSLDYLDRKLRQQRERNSKLESRIRQLEERLDKLEELPGIVESQADAIMRNIKAIDLINDKKALG